MFIHPFKLQVAVGLTDVILKSVIIAIGCFQRSSCGIQCTEC